MRRRGTLLLPLLLLPLAACGGNDEEPEAKSPETSACMTHQEPAVDLEGTRPGLPDIGGLVGRSWEADEGRTDADAHGTACADLDFDRPRGWKFVRMELRLTDGAQTVTASSTADDDFGVDVDLWAYECVDIDATVVLSRHGKQARWTAHSQISPRCTD